MLKMSPTALALMVAVYVAIRFYISYKRLSKRPSPLVRVLWILMGVAVVVLLFWAPTHRKNALANPVSEPAAVTPTPVDAPAKP
jgi:multisubunit Na+/H+ antiporter MnhB subunit